MGAARKRGVAREALALLALVARTKNAAEGWGVCAPAGAHVRVRRDPTKYVR